ncbi:uncharacterized protein LOC116287931 [Actinia tenebrosa]|uniref:Uncharacterized protein LOC116287931 n=1 Tax=Actinia tenebrosa TaxID=6105 RepID=A0A6P8HD72_ACTTE|nr:uncharacterized protein LOC116287931 [Actinia tenebrosa]
MFCLHYVYLPRINQHLHNFIMSWNDHRIRTAGNKYPNQLWILGLVQANINALIAGTQSGASSQEWNEYGIDCDAPLPNKPGDDETLAFEVTNNPLSESDFQEFAQLVHPLRGDDCYGITIYLEACALVSERLHPE